MASYLEGLRDYLFEHADQANLISVFLILIFGVVLWFLRPGQLSTEGEKRHALEFWIFHWVPPLVLFLIFAAGRDTLFQGVRSPVDWVAVTLNDLQSILLLGFCYAFIEGKRLKVGQLWIALGLMGIAFFAYNVVSAALGPDEVTSPGSPWRYVWSLPSAFLASIAYISLGWVFLLRCGWITLPLFVVGCAYAMAQWPLYLSTVVDTEPNLLWFTTLAFLKLFVAFFFYSYFTAAFKGYDALALFQRDEGVREHFLKQLRGVRGAAQALLLALLTALVISFFGL